MNHFVYQYRSVIKYGTDLLIWNLATLVAFMIRFDGAILPWVDNMLKLYMVLFPMKALVLYFAGNYQRSWANVTYTDIIRLFWFITSITATVMFSLVALRPDFLIPLSIPVIEYLLVFPVLTFMRIGTRFLVMYKGWSLVNSGARHKKNGSSEETKKIIIVGAGEAGTITAREMFRNPQVNLKPVAFLDDDKTKVGQYIMGIPVIGAVSELSRKVREVEADEILIALPSQSGETIRYIVELAQQTDIPYRIVPGFYDLISGKINIEEIRDVDVEDLLRRKPVELDAESISEYVRGRRILVTGAGGSIGSEVVRQLIQHKPAHIVLLGRGEFSIHEIYNELKDRDDCPAISPQICDVRDRHSLEQIFEEFEPEVVFHSAAHKHVYLMEQHPDQAMFNNVFGTKNVVDLCLEYGVRRMVNISTDKAINPSSIMGASKQIAEQIVIRGSQKANRNQRFISVRFGNVLGSRGSVIPIFKEQIRKGGPVTVTHPDMVRYFMTIPEAAQLVLQAGGLADNGQVYLLDMGKPVRVLDMAKDLIRLSGFEPDKDIKIEFTGPKAGEKLYEELMTNREGMSITSHHSIFEVQSENLETLNPSQFDRSLDSLLSICSDTLPRDEQYERIRTQIKFMVPSYQLKESEIA